MLFDVSVAVLIAASAPAQITKSRMMDLQFIKNTKSIYQLYTYNTYALYIYLESVCLILIMQSNDELVDYLKQEGILYDETVEQAMRRVDRIAFINPHYQGQAYQDRALPNALGQTISQPTMVAIMSQHLSILPGMKVLEVGAGSGYQAAILSELVGPDGEIHTIERIPDLASTAKKRLVAYSNIQVHVGNGVIGLKQNAPFDRIIVTAAVEEIPQALLDQLAENGKMVIPIGHGAFQRLTLVEKIAGEIRKTDLNCNCIFVPLVN